MMQHVAADTYSHAAEFSTEHILRPGYDFGDEFEYGLGLKGSRERARRNSLAKGGSSRLTPERDR